MVRCTILSMRWLAIHHLHMNLIHPGLARYISFSYFHSLQVVGGVAVFLLMATVLNAQVIDTNLSPGALKKLSPTELMDIDVTSVSRHAEKLSETASAIQVITGDDIRRSGAVNLPEALRLAPN